jgi:hypothetical protein
MIACFACYVLRERPYDWAWEKGSVRHASGLSFFQILKPKWLLQP